jgi:hypothetical protein
MEKEFKPLYYQSKGRETNSFVSVIEREGKKIKIDFGYKLNHNKKVERLFLFIDADFGLTISDRNFIETSCTLLTRNEWITNFDFFSDLLSKDLSEIEI